VRMQGGAPSVRMSPRVCTVSAHLGRSMCTVSTDASLECTLRARPLTKRVWSASTECKGCTVFTDMDGVKILQENLFRRVSRAGPRLCRVSGMVRRSGDHSHAGATPAMRPRDSSPKCLGAAARLRVLCPTEVPRVGFARVSPNSSWLLAHRASCGLIGISHISG
jgi:hypothetical protein